MHLHFLILFHIKFCLIILKNNNTIALAITDNGDQPYLEQMASSGDVMTLQCKVLNYEPKVKVHLHCSFNDQKTFDDRCYENCDLVEGRQIDMNCIMEIKGGSVILKYTTKKSTLSSGTYFCSYRGKNSHPIKHLMEEKVNVTETLELTFSPSTVATITTGKASKPIISKESFTVQITRKQIVYLLLALLTFSIIFNVILFIRCLITRHIGYDDPSMKFSPTYGSLTACLCIERNINGFGNYRKGREDIYDNIRDMPPDSDTTKSKSSSSHESQNILISPSSSQLTRSSTFPYRQSVLVHTPTDQMAMTPLNIPPYMMPYILEDGQCVMGPVLNHRLSAHGLYDDVAADTSSSMPIRQFASTGSLNHRPKRFISSQIKASPLPEENQSTSPPFTNLHSQTDEGVEFITNDISSTYDLNSSEGTYISGKGSDSFRDPVRSAKLEMSREMMAKADTLLREAHNLLKQS